MQTAGIAETSISNQVHEWLATSGSLGRFSRISGHYGQ